MTRRALLLSVLLCACGVTPSDPPATTKTLHLERRATVDGLPFASDDVTRPGEAGPSALVRHGDALLVTYGNLHGYAPAGPGYLVAHRPETLTPGTPILLRSGEVECRNPVAMVEDGARLLVACAGAVSFGAPSNDGVLVELSLPELVVQRAVRVGNSPGSIARSGNAIWMGDGETGGLWRVQEETLAVDPTPIVPCLVDATHRGYVADVLAVDSRLFAACFNDDTVVEIDPATGTPIGAPIKVGDGPGKLAVLGGHLAVLDNLGGTMTLVDLSSTPPEPTRIALGRNDDGGSDPQGIAGNERYAAITNSAYGTLVLVDLVERRLIASVDLKRSADAPSNFPTAVAFDGVAFYVAIPALEPTGVNDLPSELVRVALGDL